MSSWAQRRRPSRNRRAAGFLFRIGLPLLLAPALIGSGALPAPDRVLDIANGLVTVQVSGPASFKVGEKVDLTYQAGLMEMLIGTYEITEVKGDVFVARVVSSTMPPSKGMTIRVSRAASLVVMPAPGKVDAPGTGAMDPEQRDPRLLAANQAGQPSGATPEAGELRGEWTFHRFLWARYIGPEWDGRYRAQAQEEQQRSMVVRFVRSGSDDYVGTIVRPPVKSPVPDGMDAWGGREHLFREGLELIRVRRIDTNVYRGENLVLGIPGSPDSAGFGRKTCDIAVFGAAAKFLSPSATAFPKTLEFQTEAGDLMLRYTIPR